MNIKLNEKISKLIIFFTIFTLILIFSACSTNQKQETANLLLQYKLENSNTSDVAIDIKDIKNIKKLIVSYAENQNLINETKLGYEKFKLSELQKNINIIKKDNSISIDIFKLKKDSLKDLSDNIPEKVLSYLNSFNRKEKEQAGFSDDAEVEKLKRDKSVLENKLKEYDKLDDITEDKVKNEKIVEYERQQQEYTDLLIEYNRLKSIVNEPEIINYTVKPFLSKQAEYLVNKIRFLENEIKNKSLNMTPAHPEMIELNASKKENIKKLDGLNIKNIDYNKIYFKLLNIKKSDMTYAEEILKQFLDVKYKKEELNKILMVLEKDIKNYKDKIKEQSEMKNKKNKVQLKISEINDKLTELTSQKFISIPSKWILIKNEIVE